MIAIVRVPYLSEYNLLDVREEPIASSAAGYLAAIGVPFRVFDFHLDRSITVDTLVASGATRFVICVRGTGLHWKYAERIALHLLENTDADIAIYGQTGKLRVWDNPDPGRIAVVPHDEQALAHALDVRADGPSFEDGLRHHPYGLDLLPAMGARANLFKATIETTRGCHFGCKFCFINHGVNYSAQFLRRPNVDVIADMRAYVEHGQRRFWFYDSEFIGGDQKQFPQLRELLADIRAAFSGSVEIMLYCRASTLDRLGAYELLASAGVNSILLGIESLDGEDLKAMRKGQKVEQAIEAIKQLRDHGIFCNLSFILFNRTATAKSIRRNIELVADLFRQPEFIYLGQTLYFSYAFESDWAVNQGQRVLSGKTRLAGSTSSTRSPNLGVTFDPVLEPLAEVYRIINYEQVRKLSELNLLKEYEPDDGTLRRQVHEWATLLTLFTLNLMIAALDEFDSGGLTLDAVPAYEDWVFESFRIFNDALLPPGISATITDKDGYPEGDWNGWERAVPTPTMILGEAA